MDASCLPEASSLVFNLILWGVKLFSMQLRVFGVSQEFLVSLLLVWELFSLKTHRFCTSCWSYAALWGSGQLGGSCKPLDQHRLLPSDWCFRKRSMTKPFSCSVIMLHFLIILVIIRFCSFLGGGLGLGYGWWKRSTIATQGKRGGWNDRLRRWHFGQRSVRLNHLHRVRFQPSIRWRRKVSNHAAARQTQITAFKSPGKERKRVLMLPKCF